MVKSKVGPEKFKAKLNARQSVKAAKGNKKEQIKTVSKKPPFDKNAIQRRMKSKR